VSQQNKRVARVGSTGARAITGSGKYRETQADWLIPRSARTSETPIKVDFADGAPSSCSLPTTKEIMNCQLLTAVVAASAGCTVPAHASVAVRTDLFQATIADAPFDFFTDLTLQGKTVVATSSFNSASSGMFDTSWGAPVKFDFFTPVFAQITGYDVVLSTHIVLDTYTGVEYGGDGTNYVNFGSSLFWKNLHVEAPDLPYTYSLYSSYILHIDGSVLPSDYYSLFAHGETFCTKPTNECIDADGRVLHASISVDSLQITPFIVPSVLTIPEASRQATLLVGLSATLLALRRRQSKPIGEA
jgi:hypothetical protein